MMYKYASTTQIIAYIWWDEHKYQANDQKQHQSINSNIYWTVPVPWTFDAANPVTDCQYES